MTRIVERFGHLDVLVNNAGNGIMGSVLDMSRDDWDSVVAGLYCLEVLRVSLSRDRSPD